MGPARDGKNQMNKLGINKPTAAPTPPTLDSVVNAFDAYRLAELPADMLARLAERAGVAKVRADVALMLAKRGGAPSKPTKLTPEQAGRLCGRSPAWVRRMAKRHNWPFAHRVSRKLLLIDEDGLTQWLGSRKA
jgi:hypothetical protein